MARSARIRCTACNEIIEPQDPVYCSVDMQLMQKEHDLAHVRGRILGLLAASRTVLEEAGRLFCAEQNDTAVLMRKLGRSIERVAEELRKAHPNAKI